MKPVRVLIPTGFGENCAHDVAVAFERAGAKATIAHVNDILSGTVKLQDFHIFNWGGGFLDGDDLGSAKAGASRLHNARVRGSGRTLLEELVWFREQGRLIGGQCNGFQLYAKSGLLPATQGAQQQVTLAANESGKFEDRWVHLKVNPKSPCVWTRGLRTLYLPIRHGEGRLLVPPGKDGEQVLRDMRTQNLIAVQYSDEKGHIAKAYPENPNGSVDGIAGLCDQSGRVFALMPHPEAYISHYTHPFWTRLKEQCERRGKKFSEEGEGLAVFRNAVRYVQEELL